jgi:hypothetical protein
MDILNYLYHSNISLHSRINPLGKEIRGVLPIINDTHFRYDFENILDFIDVFDINKSELYSDKGDIFTDYIYRGHKNYEWDLLPSVYRQKSEEELTEYQNRIRCYNSGNGPTQYREIQDFSHFVKGIDALGLNTSNSSYKLISSLNQINKLNGTSTFGSSLLFDFPEEDQLSELALAQHYGVKTRLLDFTENPYIALFFASESAFPFEFLNKDKEEKIGIWVIPKLLIEAIKHVRFLKYIDVKKYQNKYISAQKGVFIHYFPSVIEATKNNSEDTKTIDLLDITYTLDKLLTSNYENEYLDKLISEHIGKPMLFTLSHNNLFPVARKLNQLNINWTTLMPSLDGVQKEVYRQNKKLFQI